MSEKKSILVVDDDPDALAIAESVLSELENVEITTASDGHVGVARAKASPPDLMLLDVEMPGMTGFNVFAELKSDETTKNIAVIMVTGVSEKTGISFSADDMGEFFGKEPEAYLEKPVDPQKLLATVRQVLDLPAG